MTFFYFEDIATGLAAAVSLLRPKDTHFIRFRGQRLDADARAVAELAADGPSARSRQTQHAVRNASRSGHVTVTRNRCPSA